MSGSAIGRVHNGSMASARPSTRTFVFAVGSHTPILELPRAQALDLLEWLGLGRPEFGAIEVSVLLPLCRRRLWPERRNMGPLREYVRAMTAALSVSASSSSSSGAGAIVHFG